MASSNRVTIYLRHPPAQGRQWWVSRAGHPNEDFFSEAEAKQYALGVASALTAAGTTVELRCEGADGQWRVLPLPDPADDKHA